MEFFKLKAVCSDCNKEIGLNKFKIKDGWLCPECFKKYKHGFKMGKTLEEIKENCSRMLEKKTAATKKDDLITVSPPSDHINKNIPVDVVFGSLNAHEKKTSSTKRNDVITVSPPSDHINKNIPIDVNSTSLNTLEKLQFRKFISEQSGMDIKEIDSFLETISEDEKKELIISFKNQSNVNTDSNVIYEHPAPNINITTSNNNQPSCPKCGSQQTTFNKQGFGVGKALVGVVATGGIGLLAGGIGKNKILITCMKCGYKWKAG